MFKIKVDQPNGIVEFSLDGMFKLEEIEDFVRALENATLSLRGRSIKIKADLRALRTTPPEVAEEIRKVQEFGIKLGVKRVAEIVESDTLALQLNRVARESGTDKILRRFWDDESAREWLIHGDPEDSAPSARPPKR